MQLVEGGSIEGCRRLEHVVMRHRQRDWVRRPADNAAQWLAGRSVAMALQRASRSRSKELTWTGLAS